ncbi:hypothetical protein Y032_0345g3114 [Ancylostoma ceylanicum]|nr:hypothetical protein Y032_0345g3114 [Ancylostoma ceylanicum]
MCKQRWLLFLELTNTSFELLPRVPINLTVQARFLNQHPRIRLEEGVDRYRWRARRRRHHFTLPVILTTMLSASIWPWVSESGNISGSGFEIALHQSIKPRIVRSLHAEGWTFVRPARAVCSCGRLSVGTIKDDEVAHFAFFAFRGVQRVFRPTTSPRAARRDGFTALHLIY